MCAFPLYSPLGTSLLTRSVDYKRRTPLLAGDHIGTPSYDPPVFEVGGGSFGGAGASDSWGCDSGSGFDGGGDGCDGGGGGD